MCIGPAGARSNHIIVRNTVHGVASGPSRPFLLAKYFFRLARGGLRFSDFHFCILFLHFPSSPVYVRKCFSWSRRCVCPTVFQGAAAGRYTLGTPREIFEFQFCECNSVNEIWCMRFGECYSEHRSSICVGVLLCIVVYALTGPGASFSETPFF